MYSTVTTIRKAINSDGLAAALFYAHPEATAATLLHILTSQPVPSTVIVGALSALRGYRIQDKDRVAQLRAMLLEVLEVRKDMWADANSVTCGGR